LFNTEYIERLPDVSRDGKFVVYESNEYRKKEKDGNDVFEIVLRPFPNVMETRDQISTSGGRYPHFSPDWGPRGGEVFYSNLNGEMMAVPVQIGSTIEVLPEKKLFDWQKPAGLSGLLYDIMPDGRFLMTKPVVAAPNERTALSVIVNWLKELEAQVPLRSP
jgi:hypothetical protein